jgi:hypothetical protein
LSAKLLTEFEIFSDCTETIAAVPRILNDDFYPTKAQVVHKEAQRAATKGTKERNDFLSAGFVLFFVPFVAAFVPLCG